MTREMWFLIVFVVTAFASYGVTIAVRRLAIHLQIHDLPDRARKIHASPVPKLGGVAIYGSFLIGLLAIHVLGQTSEISSWRLAGTVIGAMVLVIGGILDDKYELSPVLQIIFPVSASLLVVLSGTHISYITSPLGGAVILDQVKIYGFPLLGGLVVFFWILGITYTTKFLDGMDGLVSGISVIAGIVIFALSLAPEVDQTSTAFLALIFAAAAFGFLPHNFFPARIFLGEGGSTITGFLLAVLAVISGGKIATALLILGIPILDAAWVIVRRLWFGASPFVGDRKHLHFRLLDIGLSQRQAVLFLYFLSAVFGGMAVFLQSLGKLVALGVMFAIMVVIAMGLVILYRKRGASKFPSPISERE